MKGADRIKRANAAKSLTAENRIRPNREAVLWSSVGPDSIGWEGM